MTRPDGPPPRPKVAIAPLRPERPDDRAPGAVIAVGGWVVALVLVVATAVVVAIGRTSIRTQLSADLARDTPDATADEIRQAVDISALGGAVIALVVVILAALGTTRLWDSRRSGRTILSVAAVVLVVGAVGFVLTIDPSRAALADAGLPTIVQWLVPIAAVVGVVATGYTFLPGVGRTLRA